MRLSTKVAYNTIIQVISKFFSTILGLVAIAIITRYLGRDGFGEYTTIITYLSFFGVIADLGLTLITVQMISRPGADENKILSNLLALRLLTALAVLGLAPLVIYLFPYDPIVKTGVLIAVFSFLFIAINQILVGVFQKNLRMDKVAIAEIANRIILVFGVMLSVHYDGGIIGILLATVAASLVNLVMNFCFSKPFVRFSLRFDYHIWKEALTMSWPLAITIILNLVYLRSDVIFLSVMERPSEMGIIAEVGIYGAAYKVIDVLITLPFMFAGVILPIMTAKWASNNTQAFKKILQKSFDVLMIFAIPMVIGTQLVAGGVINVIAGDEYIASAPVLKILILASGAIFLGNIFAHAIIAIDKQKKIIGAYIFTAITAVLGYIIVIPKYSYIGAAWITVYSELIIALASIYYVWKFTSFLPRLDMIFKSAAASAIMVFTILMLEKGGLNHLLIILPSAGAVYFVFLYLFKGLSKQDIDDLLNKP
jgi:O-antigen/teichoic acid export membrane protein